jgi:hypothetical protein
MFVGVEIEADKVNEMSIAAQELLKEFNSLPARTF